MGKCQEDAGILDARGELTPIARKKFIERCNQEFLFGTAGMSKGGFMFTCGPDVKPVPGLDMSDEKKYAQFYENILGTYKKIAVTLNLNGNFVAPPIIDPIALGFAINAPNIPNFKLADFLKFLTLPLIPTLAIKLGFPVPPDLVTKLPIPAIPKPPSFQIPNLDPNLLPDLLNFNISFAQKIPELLIKLFDPTVLLQVLLPILKGDLSGLCKLVFDAQIFGPLNNVNPITQIVAYKVLTEKTGECIVIAAIGSTLGSAPAGLTGTIGRELGYTPPPQELPAEKTPREKIVIAAKSGDGLSYQDEKKRDKYTQFLFPYEFDKNKKKAYTLAKNNSSCALFARSVLGFAGASDPWFTNEYIAGTAISQLVVIGRKQKAIIRNTLDDAMAKQKLKLEPLKKGDIILISEPGVGSTSDTKISQHILVVLEDHPGGGANAEPIKAIEGGQRPPGGTIGTAIAKNEYFIKIEGGRLKLGKDKSKNIAVAEPRTVRIIWDGEKMLG